MAQDYDNMAKELLTEHAHDISRFILGVDNVQVLENLDTEQQVVIGQRVDSTKRIRVDNEEAILHIELQVRDSTPKPMWARTAAYHGYLLGEYQLPCRCIRMCCTFIRQRVEGMGVCMNIVCVATPIGCGIRLSV